MALRRINRAVFNSYLRYASSTTVRQASTRIGQSDLPAVYRYDYQQRQPWLSQLPLALAATAFSLTATAEAPPLDDRNPAPLTKIENHTGVSFPVSLSSHEVLSGIGARFMRGLVKVYAVGVYFDPKGARSTLRDWQGFSTKEIITADPLWEALCSPSVGFSRTIRMVVVRNVSGNHMQNGFERALLGRVATAAKRGRCSPSKCKKDAKAFCSLFTAVGMMKIGSEIRILVEKDLVKLVVDGRLIGQVRNAQLTWAVLDMFLGSAGVVDGLRDEVAKGLETLLSE